MVVVAGACNECIYSQPVMVLAKKLDQGWGHLQADPIGIKRATMGYHITLGNAAVSRNIDLDQCEEFGDETSQPIDNR